MYFIPFLLILENCSGTATTETDSYSCFLQATSKGTCTLPTVCANYTGKGWGYSSASADCQSLTNGQMAKFNAMSGCSGNTETITFDQTQACSGKVTSSTYPIATCTVNAGMTTELKYIYYATTELTALTTDAQTDCTAKGGTYVDTSNTKIYLFSTASPFVGNFGNRTTADALCASTFSSSYSSLTCSSIHAIVSYESASIPADQISTMADRFSIPLTYPVVDAASQSHVIAANWTQMISGSLNLSLNTAGVIAVPYWTGSLSTGVADTTHNCTSWTVGTHSGTGALGSSNSTSSSWINAAGTQTCNGSAYLLCMCY